MFYLEDDCEVKLLWSSFLFSDFGGWAKLLLTKFWKSGYWVGENGDS
jgi:hypothetical protein